MEGFTPTFFLELMVAIGSAGCVYGAIRSDLKNLRTSFADEKRLREEHAKEDDESFHGIRSDLGEVSTRVAVIEGRLSERP